MDTEYKKINTLLNKVFEGQLDSLKKTSEKLKRIYKSIFSVRNILGKGDFSDIYIESENKEEEQCNTLAEQCICRAHNIDKLLINYENDSNKKELVEDLNMFWTIISFELLPLEVLWGMEYEKEDDRPFSKTENEVYEFFKNWANYYLKTTKKYYLLLTDECLNDDKLPIFLNEEIRNIEKHKKIKDDKNNNNSIKVEDSELKESQKNQIVLDNKKETVKSLKLINKDENK